MFAHSVLLQFERGMVAALPVQDHLDVLGFNAHDDFAQGRTHDPLPERLGEIAAAVGEKIDMARGADPRPCREHIMVVDRGHGDLVDALGLELRLVGDEAREMVLVAGGRESARQAEQHHRLAGEVIFRFDRLRAVRGQKAERGVWQAFADRDRHWWSSGWRRPAAASGESRRRTTGA